MTSADPSVATLDVQDNGVAVVRIHRPEVKNALNAQVREALAEHFRALAKRRDVRAIVLTGGEQCFVAGADIKEFAHAGAID
ncbi:enoyl-CoA hydratase-related protein, partial [Klebsiella pneumoniae]|uniref:enoyl-CoA hydratase-related protein n=1 Tax=Klebsiella pneumoniae TaxID=573 RepID=UPI00273104D2